jgi:predicted RNA-binding Zn-ribbon protein involved in translation (DUF1610 family)
MSCYCYTGYISTYSASHERVYAVLLEDVSRSGVTLTEWSQSQSKKYKYTVEGTREQMASFGRIRGVSSEIAALASRPLLVHCTSCGSKAGDSTFCDSCGEDLAAIAKHLQEMSCPNCQEPMLRPQRAKTPLELANKIRSGRTGHHCYNCGFRLSAPPVTIR